MTPSEYRDRLERLTRRGAVLLADLQRLPNDHQALIALAWKEALGSRPPTPTEPLDSEEERRAATFASKLEAVLCLLERVVRPSAWLQEQAIWFDRARQCLDDAIQHAATVLGGDLFPSPILIVEPVDSPLYYARVEGRSSWLYNATFAELPLPLVVCPGHLIEEPWEWATLFHELGHRLEVQRADGEHLAAAIAAEPQQEEFEPWLRWIEESIADLYAGLLGGQGAVDTLKSLFAASSEDAANSVSSSSHPPAQDRLTVLDTAWTALRDATTPSGSSPCATVARLLAERFRHWQQSIQQQSSAAASPPTHARFVPGMLHGMRVLDRDPVQLRAACDHAFRGIQRPQWSVTAAHLATLTQAIRYLVETRVEPGVEGLKVPPRDLLKRYTSISFVGATHGQLLEAMKKAKKEKEDAPQSQEATTPSKPWERIEVFALADEPLRKLVLGPGISQTGDALIEERDRSLRELKAYLGPLGVDHAQYLYTEPYFFASYWDVEDNESRPRSAPPAHIHTSHVLWGSDLRTAPGNDYEAPAGRPLPLRMKRCVDALSYLRTNSKRLP